MTSFHLHLVSDATGETLNAVAKAAITQFDGAAPVEHMWSLVRTKSQMDRVVAGLATSPGIVMFTLVRLELREALEEACQHLDLPCVAVLDPALRTLASYLGAESRGVPGLQHAIGAAYFDRIGAMDYCLVHDDGQSQASLGQADVILVGVSRTSKTPTCVYLANRGIKSANVPIIPNQPLPPVLDDLDGPLVVALTASPERLVQIRRSRLIELRETGDTAYVNLGTVKEEVAAARCLFAGRGWPVIDVSRRSIEETAARILTLLAHRNSG